MKTKAEAWQDQETPSSNFSSSEGPEGEDREDGDGIPRPFRPAGKIHIHYPKELKFHVTLEALREKIPQGEIGAMYGVPESLVSIWKKAAVEAIRGNIHYKQRKRREALGLSEHPAAEEGSPAVVPTETVQHLCQMMRAAARQIERDPAILEKLLGRGPAD